MHNFWRALLLLAAGLGPLAAKPFIVVAYNVENLVDLDGQAGFEAYQPGAYTRDHALTKLRNIAEVVARFEHGRGPDVLLLCELEVDLTPAAQPIDVPALLAKYAHVKLEHMLGAGFTPEIADLPSEVLLAKALADRGMTGYHVRVGENPPPAAGGRRLEQKTAVFTRFPIKAARSHPTLDARAILEVQVEVEGAPLYLFANHWKSGASDPVTEPTRMANAQTLRSRLDEILRADPNADIIIGGDLNSQYNHKRRYPQLKRTGLNDVLGSQGNELAIRGKDRDLYNLWYELPGPERGSDTFRGEWGTLMHLIISRGLYDFRGVQYVDNSFAVAKFPGLNVDAAGLPVRWSFAGKGSGFSDHLPIFAKFTTVPDGRADRYLDLKQASEEKLADEPVVRTKAPIDLEKTAITASSLRPGTSIRGPEYLGRIFRVEGVVAPGDRLAVQFLGETYDVWSYDAELRGKLRAQYPAGSTIRFYGELGRYRDRWQFVVQEPDWVR